MEHVSQSLLHHLVLWLQNFNGLFGNWELTICFGVGYNIIYVINHDLVLIVFDAFTFLSQVFLYF
jgi:hypothetical protein